MAVRPKHVIAVGGIVAAAFGIAALLNKKKPSTERRRARKRLSEVVSAEELASLDVIDVPGEVVP